MHANPMDIKSINGYHPLERPPGICQNSGVALYIEETLIFKKRNDLVSKLGKNIDFFNRYL